MKAAFNEGTGVFREAERWPCGLYSTGIWLQEPSMPLVLYVLEEGCTCAAPDFLSHSVKVPAWSTVTTMWKKQGVGRPVWDRTCGLRTGTKEGPWLRVMEVS